MTQNFSMLYGIKADATKTFAKGMPVSLRGSIITPYTAADNNYIGVSCEEQIPHTVEMQRIGENIISVGTTGFGQVIASGVIAAGDMIEPTETGYAKTTDAAKAVGKAMTAAAATRDWIKAVLYKI